MDIENVKRNIEFSEEDRNNLKNLFPIISNHGHEIINEVIRSLSKDENVVKLMEANYGSLERAEESWYQWLEIIFSSDINEQFVKEISSIGLSNVDTDVEETIVIQAASLFLIKILEKIMSLQIPNSEKLIPSAIKAFSISLMIMIESYRQELMQSFVEFTGMNPELIKRQIKIQRKKRKEKEKV